MKRSLAALLALAAVVAGCATLPLGPSESERRNGEAVRPTPDHRTKPRRELLVVTVLDGDTRRRVRRARLRIGTRARVADRHGKVRIRVRRRAPVRVTVRARGYTAKSVRLAARRHRFVTIRVHRPALQWRTYGADAARTQAQRRIRVRPPFRFLWSQRTGGLIEFPAVVSDGFAYIGNAAGTVLAIDMRNGRRVWRYNPPGGKMASSPAIVRDELVVHGMDGFVRVLDRRTGRLRWQRSIGSPIESSPLVRHGVDYFGAWDGNVYALDLRTRRLRWIHRAGWKITASASLFGRTIYIGDYGGRLRALALRTGRLRWAGVVDGRIYGTAAVAHGRVFVPSSTGKSLTAFTTRGRFLWRVETGDWVYSSPAVWGKRVFFGSYDGHLYAVSAHGGRVLWRAAAGGPISGAAVAVAGVVYAGSIASRIIGVDAASGRTLLRFPHGEYVPVSGHGGRLLLHGYSRLFAVEPRRR